MSQSDQLLRFLFRERDVRGEVVKVGASLDAMLAGHQYPQPVKQLLAELVAATSLLTATLKFEGQIAALEAEPDGVEMPEKCACACKQCQPRSHLRADENRRSAFERVKDECPCRQPLARLPRQS